MRFVVAALVLALAVGSAAAQTTTAPAAPGALDSVYACRGIQQEAQRLACYDAAVGRLQQAQTSGDIVAVDRQQAQQIRREAFGFQLPSLPQLFNRGGNNATAEADEAPIAFTIQSIGHRSDGKAVFTMTNGQVWTQVDDHSTSRVRSGGGVTIRHAALMSFLMSVEAGGPAIRVRRQE